MLGNFQEERDFIVESAPLPADIVPCIAQPTTHALKSLGFLKKGFLSVGAIVENSHVGRGRALRVSVASRNDASVDIDRVRVKLVELIEYQAVDESDTLKVDLTTLDDIEDFLPGLVKNHAKGSDVRRSIRQGAARTVEANYGAIYEDLISGENKFKVVVPKTARDSYDGSLIKISHYLKITFVTKSMGENPFVKIPIVVGNPRDLLGEIQTRTAARRPNDPLATVIFEDEISERDDSTTFSLGSRAEVVPMANAVLIRESENKSLLQPQGSNAHNGYESEEDDLFADNESESEYYFAHQNLAPIPPPQVAPSAPDESLLRKSTSPMSAESSPYSPLQKYDAQPGSKRVEYTYDDSDVSEISPSPVRGKQYRHSYSLWLLEQVVEELKGSIHDYEVILSKSRDPDYHDLFTTLTAKEFGSIINHVSMSHQVKVALMLAKQNSGFTCEHCAAALKRTSQYFRSNMVETLIPYCTDFEKNRDSILGELSEWDQMITSRAFGLYHA